MIYLETRKLHKTIEKAYPSNGQDIGSSLHIYEILHLSTFDEFPEGEKSIVYDIMMDILHETDMIHKLSDMYNIAIIVSRLYKKYPLKPILEVYGLCKSEIKRLYYIEEEVK